ncbi:Uncharacterized [Moorella glycerini]|uniref:Uncharacterized protein n=2 Tax=Neomoorella TaxID=44260 RepID=A0A9X7P4Q4_9FIRM|nr:MULTISPECIES: hypothetical protein [Moorella]KYH31946.1 hypothetical protein MOMUL_18280 [Moorella mulderi DSM 14980]PRR68890.1 hypothetical protein MOST_31720 [Moorella stamsii]CEP67511.1 Uncharacterized [Moorella glycerini]
MTDLETKAARQAGIIYTGISLGMALLFLVLTFLTGKTYTLVARAGGAVWVFILTMIITMPLVIPAVKNRVMG